MIDIPVERLRPLADAAEQNLGFRLAPRHAALLGVLRRRPLTNAPARGVRLPLHASSGSDTHFAKWASLPEVTCT